MALRCSMPFSYSVIEILPGLRCVQANLFRSCDMHRTICYPFSVISARRHPLSGVGGFFAAPADAHGSAPFEKQRSDFPVA
jgi:hypothetical protein